MSEFLAEARVVIRPDTTRFRAELQTQLLAATKGVVVPVQAQVTSVGAGAQAAIASQAALGTAVSQTSEALALQNLLLGRGAALLDVEAIAAQEDAAAQAALGAQRERTAQTTRSLAAVQAAAANSSRLLALAQAEVVGAASEVGAAQIVLTRSTAAVSAAEKELTIALRAKNIALIDAASQSVRLAEAQRAEAITALAAARAQEQHGRSLGAVGTAAAASGASMLGLRGAVLTAGAAFLGATVAFQALARSVGLASQLETELNVFRVTAGATADEMERVSDTAKALGRDITLPGVAAQDAAEAMSQLARAGLDVEDAIAATRGVLQLATAAQIDNAQATELVANALNSFKLAGEDATRVADLFAGAANESQGSIVDMGIALRQVSAVASGLGISLEDTVTLLTQLSRAGLSSSDAGTSLRQTFLRLIQNLPKVNEEVDRLGLNLRDVNGNIRPAIFEELGTKLRKLAPAARQAAIANLGGADAIRTYLLLSREAVGTFDSVQASITQQGLASEQAAARTAGLSGDVEAAKNELATLGTTAGRVASGPLSFLARTATLAAGAINDFNQEVEDTGVLEELEKGLGDLFNNFQRIDFAFRRGVLSTKRQSAAYAELGDIAQGVTGVIDELAQALQRAGRETISRQGLPDDEGLGVQQILNRVQGFDSAETRARIRGDTDELLSVLQTEQDFLRSQLERQFVQNRPALRDQLQDALLGAIQDVESISRQGASEAKRVATEARRAREEADRAFLALLGDRREDASRRAARAAESEGLQDDIRAQNRIQELIKQQIEKIRDRIKDEQTRKVAIRDLRIALIASRQEEEQLRAEQRQQALDARETSLELDISFAETTENTDREIAARQRLIALLRKQQAAVKKGTNEWKRLRNEIAEQQAAIKEAREQAEEGKEDGKSAQQFFSEQLQAQQGFAANLLGNLITGPTAGLVGVPAPSAPAIPDLGARIGAEVGAAAGRAGAVPTAGQANTEIDVLRRILEELRRLNGSYDAPEAIHQKKVGAGNMDNVAM